MGYDIGDIDIVARLWDIIERSSVATEEARQQADRILQIFYEPVVDD